MRNVLVLVCCCILLCGASLARACGTFDMYMEPSAQRPLPAILSDLNCISVYDYHESRHAPFLFGVILQSVRSRTDSDRARRLFEKYLCLPSMKTRKEYGELVAAFGTTRCNPEGYFQARVAELVVVDVDGARIRTSASPEARVVDRAYRGEVLKLLSVQGNWRRVRTRWDNVGWVH